MKREGERRREKKREEERRRGKNSRIKLTNTIETSFGIIFQQARYM